MLASLLAMSLLAASPSAPQVEVQAAHATALVNLHAFLQTASTYAPMLSPDRLGRTLGGPLAIDLLDPAGWAAAGLDPKAPVWSVLSDAGSAVMVGVASADRVRARARSNLPSSGDVTETQHRGITLLVARAPGTSRIAAAVAVSRRRAAIWLGGADSASLLRAVQMRAPQAQKSGTLSARFLGLGPRAVTVGLTPTAHSMAIEVAVSDRGGLLAPSAHDPFAALAVPAPVVVHAALSQRGLSELRPAAEALLQSLLTASGKPFPTAPMRAVLDGLAGPVAGVATGLDPDQGKGEGVRAAYFLGRQVEAGQVRDPQKTRAALDALDKALDATGLAVRDAPAKAPGAHHLVSTGGRTLYFGLSGAVLYLASDVGARDALLAALPRSAGADVHAGAVQLDGPRAAAALGHLSIFDAAGSNALTALFAIAVEAGPLLRTIAPTSFALDVDPRGARLRGTLTLTPTKAP